MTGVGDRIPVNVITGFLGSGKTTLLNRLLRAPESSGVAILVNELGEVGLDHDLLVRVDDSTVVLQGGCVCCTIRDDLALAMRELHRKRERGEVPAFARLAIETTGLADPAPILYTLLTEPVLCHRYRLSNVVTTVDALHAASGLDEYPECTGQVALADRLIITKDDLSDAGSLAALESALKRINPAAPVFRENRDRPAAGELLAGDVLDPASRGDEVRRWIAEQATAAATRAPLEAGTPRHGRDVAAICLVLEGALDWSAFGIWLTMLLHRYGRRVLRVKGLLNVAGLQAPVLVQCVQHTIHPPVHLAAWPSSDQRSRLVLIVESLARERLLHSLDAFNRLGAGDGDARIANR